MLYDSRPFVSVVKYNARVSYMPDDSLCAIQFLWFWASNCSGTSACKHMWVARTVIELISLYMQLLAVVDADRSLTHKQEALTMPVSHKSSHLVELNARLRAHWAVTPRFIYTVRYGRLIRHFCWPYAIDTKTGRGPRLSITGESSNMKPLGVVRSATEHLLVGGISAHGDRQERCPYAAHRSRHR